MVYAIPSIQFHRDSQNGLSLYKTIGPRLGHPQRLVGFRSARLRTAKDLSSENAVKGRSLLRHTKKHNRSEFGFVFRDFVVLFQNISKK